MVSDPGEDRLEIVLLLPFSFGCAFLFVGAIQTVALTVRCLEYEGWFGWKNRRDKPWWVEADEN